MDRSWPRTILSPEDAQSLYPKLWSKAMQLFYRKLGTEDIAKVVSLVVDTCADCRERNDACDCWNQE